MAYDDKGTASHYDDQRINMAHMVERIWGTEAAMLFHEMNAFKYRMRIGKKDDPSQEILKAEWSEKMAKFLKNKTIRMKGIGLGDHPLYSEFKDILEGKIGTECTCHIGAPYNSLCCPIHKNDG